MTGSEGEELHSPSRWPEQRHGRLLLVYPAEPVGRSDDRGPERGRLMCWRFVTIDTATFRHSRRRVLIGVGTPLLVAALVLSAWAVLADQMGGSRQVGPPGSGPAVTEVTTRSVTGSERSHVTASQAPTTAVDPTTTAPPGAAPATAAPPTVLRTVAPPVATSTTATSMTEDGGDTVWGPICGFRPGAPVDVKINGQPAGPATADANGCVSAQ